IARVDLLALRQEDVAILRRAVGPKDGSGRVLEHAVGPGLGLEVRVEARALELRGGNGLPFALGRVTHGSRTPAVLRFDPAAAAAQAEEQENCQGTACHRLTLPPID